MTIEVSPTQLERPDPLRLSRFEACILAMDPACEPYMVEFRNSPLNHSSVLIGVRAPDSDLGPYSKYGFNAVVAQPLEEKRTLEAIRSSCLLTIGQLRRFVRAPLVVEVKAKIDGVEFKARSVEISGGGMALELPPQYPQGSNWELKFTLPGDTAPITIHGSTCWRREDQGTIGVLFNPDDAQHLAIKQWVESFLGG